MSGSRLLLALAQSRRGRHENKEKRSINKEYCSEMMENKSYRKGHNSVTRVQLRRSLECERNTVEGKETEKLRNK